MNWIKTENGSEVATQTLVEWLDWRIGALESDMVDRRSMDRGLTELRIIRDKVEQGIITEVKNKPQGKGLEQ